METNSHLDGFSAALSQTWLNGLAREIQRLSDAKGSPYRDDFERHLALLHRAFPDRPWPDWPVEGFVSMNREILREDLYFRKTGVYAAAAAESDSVFEHVYNNPEVMDRYYLVGLFCTYFVWPHHWEMLEFFRDRFLDGEDVASFAEFGVGHGLLAKLALERWPAAQATLLDLSPHSLDFSRRLLTAAGVIDRCRLVQSDVLQAPDLPRADRIVCSELLEHVSDPRRLLARIAASLNPCGRAFITGAVTAAQADHVYLFESPQDVLDMVASAGLRIRDSRTLLHPNRAAEARAPRVVAVMADLGN